MEIVLAATPVGKTKGTVIMMSNVKKITNVELTTAKICLALSLQKINHDKFMLHHICLRMSIFLVREKLVYSFLFGVQEGIRIIQTRK